MYTRFCTFISGLGGEADAASTLCTQMGALTPVGAVCADLPANTEVPGRPLPDTLLTSSFTDREAAVSNSMETEWDHAALESCSADCLPLEGTFSPPQPPFLGTCHVKCHIVKNHSFLKGKGSVFPYFLSMLRSVSFQNGRGGHSGDVDLNSSRCQLTIQLICGRKRRVLGIKWQSLPPSAIVSQ